MSETETEHDESGEERIDESGRNPTQRRMDEEGVVQVPVADDPAEDEPWAT
jgi:hypothetical protein